jgi:hypothetical protein
MKPSAFFFTICLLGVTAACGTPNAIPTVQPIAVSTLTPTFTPPTPTVPSHSHTATSTPKPTPTFIPTSFPGPPQLIQPADGAVLPQPVYPDGWVFSWTARTGPCYAAITIEGPGERRLGDEYIDWRTTGYRYTYAATEHFSDDALGPWHWFVDVICMETARNRSETRTFWVETSPVPSAPTAQPGLDIRGQVRLTDGSGLANVRLCINFATNPGETVAITYQDGYYQSEHINIPGDERVSVWAELEGYTFLPKLYNWRYHRGHEVRMLDFVAHPTTATDVPPAPCHLP